jgi:tetratricopeptide (TPR) repeat protein
MPPVDKKESKNFTFLKIIALIVLIFAAFKLAPFAANLLVFLILYVPLLLLIGFVIWIIVGEPLSEIVTSFLLSSGGKILKPKYYSKARSLVMQNKLEDAIKLYQKILNEDNTDVIAYSEMGDIYFEKLKDYSAAFNCYDRIERYAQETTDIIFAINRKVDIYLFDKNYLKAIEELGKITKNFPKIKDAERAEERIKNLKDKIVQSN